MNTKRVSTSLTLALLILLSTARGSANAPASDSTVALEQARQAASALGGELMKTLRHELSTGGTLEAVRVCSEIAPSIAAKHSHEGLEVRRVSLKPRNPANAPDAYEERKLSELESLRAQGELPKEISEVVEKDGRRTLRYLRPISIMPPCLKCHGNREKIDPQVLELLQRQYPDDPATGYDLGDLRGAISVSVDL